MTHTTFIHTSDLQLGMRRKFLSLEAQSRFDDARLRAVTRLGEIAQDRGAEFIVVAGDVFEHNSLEPTTLGRALEALRNSRTRSRKLEALAADEGHRTHPGPGSAFEARRREQLLHDLLGSVSEAHAQTLVLTAVLGHSLAETAEILGVPLNTVR